MKQKILIILSSLFIIINNTKAQSCIIWSDDFGAKEEHHLRTVRAQARLYEAQRKIMSQQKIEYRDVLLLRGLNRSAEFHSMREYGIIKNSCLTRELKSPRVYTR